MPDDIDTLIHALNCHRPKAAPLIRLGITEQYLREAIVDVGEMTIATVENRKPVRYCELMERAFPKKRRKA